MTGWVATKSVPAGWSELCAKHDCLFHSQSWMELLERSFGCQSIYVSNDGLSLGAGISVFRAGPFKLGYLGFPVGGFVGGGGIGGSELVHFQRALVGQGPVAIRIPASAFGRSETLDLCYAATSETAIVDLQSWSLSSASENRRRDVKKSLRSGLDLMDATDPSDGTRLYDLYRKTIVRNRGSLRYTASYFEELIRLANAQSNIRVLLARMGDSIVAFNVGARHGLSSFYLHGAFDWDMRAYRPSALLMNEAIKWAKEDGCHSFNLMSSPPGQVSLIRFKEHWGAETREHRTYTLPMSWTYGAFRMAEWLYRQAHRS